MLNSILVISLGVSVGAITRWLLGTSPNAVFPTIRVRHDWSVMREP